MASSCSNWCRRASRCTRVDCVGVELQLEQTEAAAAQARARGLKLRFERADAYALPLAEFRDVAFSFASGRDPGDVPFSELPPERSWAWLG